MMCPDGLTVVINTTGGEHVCDVEFTPEEAQDILSAGLDLLFHKAITDHLRVLGDDDETVQAQDQDPS